MTLLQAWKDFFTFIQPNNFKLFVLVTLKSVIEAYKLLFRYWWWLFVIIVIHDYFFYGVSVQYLPYGWVIEKTINHLFVFVICLSTRPSVLQKTCAYFRKYFLYSWYITLIISLNLIFGYTASPIDSFFVVGYIFFLMFFLDSDLSIKQLLFSVIRSLKMLVYNFPICLFLCIAFLLLWTIAKILSGLSGEMAMIIIVQLLLPVLVCTFANIYVKKLHEQFDIYFTQPK